MTETTERILVIKLGAFGDIVQATGPFAAIRRHHPAAFIVLLTGRPYAEFMQGSPCFDAVWEDERPGLWSPRRLWALRARLRGGRFTRVYDLQTSDRSSFYFRLMGRPPWSGIARGCAWPHANPDRDRMHTLDRQAEQLVLAGLPVTPAPDVSWVRADESRFGVQAPFVLMVAGGAPHRPGKRWPAERYAALVPWLWQRGVTPVLIGTERDRPHITALLTACPRAVDLLGQTTCADLVGLGRRASAAIGNDTGPMHLLAVSGCPCVVLFGPSSDPAFCAPRGSGTVTVMRAPRLDALQVTTVAAALTALGKDALSPHSIGSSEDSVHGKRVKDTVPDAIPLP
ncbi:MAG: ADP-heptose of LPS heptosyltransferase [Rhodospirillaceae bacterium]|nr:MAG: ADP-heptose of LPS heptosyltransferase [Rhodospirillaceae bacterium]